METRPAHVRPLRLLATAWLCSAVLLALPGWLLLALSEGDGGRRAGGGIAAAAVLAFATGLRVLTTGRGARPLSYGVSALVALAGLGAVAGVRADGPLFGRDALLLGGLPVFLAVLTATIALRGRSHS